MFDYMCKESSGISKKEMEADYRMKVSNQRSLRQKLQSEPNSEGE